MARRDHLASVFQDTYKLTYSFDRTSERYVGILLDYVPTPICDNTSITVKNIDCITECIKLLTNNKGCKLSLLNFASDKKAGGGCQTGASAQEEDICRCTSLYHSLVKHKYPLEQNELIYSTSVAIVKDATYTIVDKRYTMSVISMAAIRHPYTRTINETNYYKFKSDKDVMTSKVRMILQTAHYHKLDTLVLGAFGCGVFGNPPNEVATIFQLLLTNEFKTVSNMYRSQFGKKKHMSR